MVKYYRNKGAELDMRDTLELVAILRNDKVYVKETDEYGRKLSQYKLRFNAKELKSHSRDWKVFETIPSIAEEFIKGIRYILKYKLKEGYTETEKTPLHMTRDDFKCCEDNCENSEIQGLYEPVYRSEPDQWNVIDMTIEVIDSNCEPLINTKYAYVVKFPGYIDKHMIVRHMMPCYIEGDDAYDYIRKAVKNNIPTNCIISSDYDFTFTVKTIIPYLSDPLIKESKTIIDISKKSYNYAGKVYDIHADNYYLLEEKMDKIIQEYLDKMKQKIHVCPRCQGKGWIEDE